MFKLMNWEGSKRKLTSEMRMACSDMIVGLMRIACWLSLLFLHRPDCEGLLVTNYEHRLAVTTTFKH